MSAYVETKHFFATLPDSALRHLAAMDPATLANPAAPSLAQAELDTRVAEANII